MQHIRTQREIFKQVIKENADDVYDFLQLANGGKENFLRDIEKRFTDKQEEELTKYMIQKLQGIQNPAVWDLEEEFSFWIEKNRGYPLGMGELSDISEWAELWAKDNGYGYLYRNED